MQISYTNFTTQTPPPTKSKQHKQKFIDVSIKLLHLSLNVNTNIANILPEVHSGHELVTGRSYFLKLSQSYNCYFRLFLRIIHESPRSRKTRCGNQHYNRIPQTFLQPGVNKYWFSLSVRQNLQSPATFP